MDAIDSRPFHSMIIQPPIPEIQFDLENSRSKLKVKGTPVSAMSFWLISLVLPIRESYQLPSPSFHDNWASYSRDTIWPWKFKVKGQGERYPSQHSVQLTHFLSVSHQGILSTPFPFVPWQSGFLSVSHQGILSTPFPFVPWQSGFPFSRYNLTLKIQGQRSNIP